MKPQDISRFVFEADVIKGTRERYGGDRRISYANSQLLILMMEIKFSRVTTLRELKRKVDLGTKRHLSSEFAPARKTLMEC